jgi:uncharacterized protein YkwD
VPRHARFQVQLVLAAFVLASIWSVAAPDGARAAWTSGSYSSVDEDLMVQLVNQARASYGLRALTVDTRLRSLAEWRSSDMVGRSYLGHLIPTSCDYVFSYMTAQGIQYSWAAENVGWNGYSDDQATQWMFDWFMNSSVHRANILDARATSIGIGAYKGDWVYGSACGQTGTGASYPATHMYTMIFMQAATTDTIAPTVSVPASRLYASTLGTSTAAVRTSWSGSDASGIASYLLQRQVNAGSWATVTLAASTSTSVVQSLALGSTYRYRVRATDTKGNVSAFAYGATVKPSVTQQSSTAVTYGGTWASVANSYTSGGSYKYASAAGAWASFTFSGSSVGWVALKSTSGGSADVYVDGVLKVTVSLYASTTSYRPVVYAPCWSNQGTHTIKIVARGNGRVYLDAFVRLSFV